MILVTISSMARLAAKMTPSDTLLPSRNRVAASAAAGRSSKSLLILKTISGTGVRIQTRKIAPSFFAQDEAGARNDTPFDLLAGFAGSFTGPPILSPGIDRGEQQIGRAPEAHSEVKSDSVCRSYALFSAKPCYLVRFHAISSSPSSAYTST